MNTTTIATRTKLAAAIGVGALALTSCGNGGGDGDGDFGSVEVPLSWIMTAEFAGMYYAVDEGYYEEEGFEEVELITGGPAATPSATQIATGTGLAGLSNPIDVGSFIDAEGDDANIKVIGSVFQRNAFAIFSLAENPATEPEDLIGMSIGVAPNNEPVYFAFLEVNGIDPDDVEMVSTGGTAEPLSNGEVDAYIGYATNQAIDVELDGHDVEYMYLYDHGLPFAAGSIIATEETIENDREALKALLAGTIRGWHTALEDHDDAATVTVEDWAADQGLDFEHQLLTAERQAPLISDEWTDENGLLTMSDELVADTLQAVSDVGYDVPDDLFDLSLLEEVYEENPDLIP
ncbi:ABC transporter substrate-binding protein [Nesterenkonia ebinurensis]|uniref:ABC transporter substrate-binding protein n=1 Tax=Nesterenkonia ebinurensis TaxID=2608252 RepID=UPI00123D495A|nr:ABC transporter substrate-binding protein [Nesterenkonia ebinurensis]